MPRDADRGHRVRPKRRRPRDGELHRVRAGYAAPGHRHHARPGRRRYGWYHAPRTLALPDRSWNAGRGGLRLRPRPRTPPPPLRGEQCIQGRARRCRDGLLGHLTRRQAGRDSRDRRPPLLYREPVPSGVQEPPLEAPPAVLRLCGRLWRDSETNGRPTNGSSQAGKRGGPLKEVGQTRGLISAERRLTTVFPTNDPAGTVATCTAGLLEFSATLSWNRVEDLPQAPTLPALPETARCSVVETDDPATGRRGILGEILALCERDLGSALQAVLRSLTTSAALSDAVLETRATRVAPLASAPATTLQALALDLRDAGFEVRFAPSWTPVPVGAIGLGVLGAEQELQSFLEAHLSWRAL